MTCETQLNAIYESIVGETNIEYLSYDPEDDFIKSFEIKNVNIIGVLKVLTQNQKVISDYLNHQIIKTMTGSQNEVSLDLEDIKIFLGLQ